MSCSKQSTNFVPCSIVEEPHLQHHRKADKLMSMRYHQAVTTTVQWAGTNLVSVEVTNECILMLLLVFSLHELQYPTKILPVLECR